MGKMIIGGYPQSVVFNLGDETCRAVQSAVLARLLGSGKGFFFRMGGESAGNDIQQVVWISANSAIRFEYATSLLPELNQEYADHLKLRLNEADCIVIPGEVEAMLAADIQASAE